ncbi:MAG: sigma-70 family RNA polymerase sigma factor, partial [Deltaproteobacteria bacterium]
NGTTPALAAFIACVWPRLTASLRKQYNFLSAEDIEDIIQYTVIRAWRAAPTYRGEHGEQSAWAWVFQIAHRQARGPYRRRAERTTPWDEEQLNTRPAGEECMPEGPTHTTRRTWENFLKTLKPREREIARERFQGISLKEIATQQGISTPRVHQILQQIYRKAGKFFS